MTETTKAQRRAKMVAQSRAAALMARECYDLSGCTHTKITEPLAVYALAMIFAEVLRCDGQPAIRRIPDFIVAAFPRYSAGLKPGGTHYLAAAPDATGCLAFSLQGAWHEDPGVAHRRAYAAVWEALGVLCAPIGDSELVRA